jgi:hypothetical protein
MIFKFDVARRIVKGIKLGCTEAQNGQSLTQVAMHVGTLHFIPHYYSTTKKKSYK